MNAVQTYTGELLNSKRVKGDPSVDAFIQQSFTDSKLKIGLYTWLQNLEQNASLNAVPDLYASEAFIANARQLPSWADHLLMQKGSAFFVKYAEQIMQLLGLLSLPYCYAAADGAMVLHLSQRLKDDPAKRLSDTAEFIWDVMSPEAFQPEGKGFSACLKIRLRHSAARYYTLKSGSWNDDFGFPVNQEDMAGTNLSFSLIVIRGLRKLGYAVSYLDQQAFMHLWNLIGSLLGLDDDLIPHDGKSANTLEKSIRERHFKSSLHGKELTAILLTYFAGVTKAKASQKQTVMLMRYLLGDEVADFLGLPAAEMPGYLPAMFKLSANWPEFKNDEPVLVRYKKKYSEFLKFS